MTETSIVAQYSPPQSHVQFLLPNSRQETESTAAWRARIREVAERVGADADDLIRTLTCESGLNPLAFNRNDPHGGSYGIAQFQKATFFKNAPLADITSPDWYNPDQQIQTAAWMFANGMQGQWSCWYITHGLKVPWQ